ncbi:TPA: alpha-hydroxy-acid oxidizing protein, partial [Staphylococcus aureus]|nr:alpha-hydroxy-acid oxidizing protein [Staphylococcus aureus]
VFASGGLRTPLDAIKSLALGAKATGMSRPFLNQVENNGIAHTVAYVESFIEHMKSIMTMLDAKNIDDLTQKQIVFSPEILSWIEQRNLNIHRG